MSKEEEEEERRTTDLYYKQGKTFREIKRRSFTVTIIIKVNILI